MGKSAAKKAKRMSKRVMFDALIDLFQRNSDRALTYSRIWKELHLTTHPQKMLCGDFGGTDTGQSAPGNTHHLSDC